ncbi:hypothetical protein ACLOJK_034839, partial [Asimina triloba]
VHDLQRTTGAPDSLIGAVHHVVHIQIYSRSSSAIVNKWVKPIKSRDEQIHLKLTEPVASSTGGPPKSGQHQRQAPSAALHDRQLPNHSKVAAWVGP